MTLEQITTEAHAKLNPHKIPCQIFDLGSEVHIEPSTRHTGELPAGSFDGMHIGLDRKTGIWEVVEAQAGEKQNELHIFLQTKSLAVALNNLIKKGNQQKPIKIWT